MGALAIYEKWDEDAASVLDEGLGNRVGDAGMEACELFGRDVAIGQGDDVGNRGCVGFEQETFGIDAFECWPFHFVDTIS